MEEKEEKDLSSDEEEIEILDNPTNSKQKEPPLSSRKKVFKKKKFLYYRKSSPSRNLSNYRKTANTTNFHRTTGRETPNRFAMRREYNTVNLTYFPKFGLVENKVKNVVRYSDRCADRFKEYEKAPALCYDLDKSLNYYRPRIRGGSFSTGTTRSNHFYTKMGKGLYKSRRVRRDSDSKKQKNGKSRGRSRISSKSSPRYARPKTSHGGKMSKKSYSSVDRNKRPKTADPRIFRGYKPVDSTMIVDRQKSRVRRDVLSVPVIDFGRTLSREEANRPGMFGGTSNPIRPKSGRSKKKKRKRRGSGSSTSRSSHMSRRARNFDKFMRRKEKLAPNFRRNTSRKNHKSSWLLKTEGSHVPFKIQKVELLSNDKKVGKIGIPDFKKVPGRKGRYLTPFEVHDLHYRIKRKSNCPKVNLVLKPGRTNFKDSRHDMGTTNELARMTDSLCELLDSDIRKVNKFEKELFKAEKKLRKKEKPLNILM